ncbi:MAG: hypothetical protein R2695_15230 [Acidimicrobiales bacterium]
MPVASKVGSAVCMLIGEEMVVHPRPGVVAPSDPVADQAGDDVIDPLE